jgi:hypothetical protein
MPDDGRTVHLFSQDDVRVQDAARRLVRLYKVTYQRGTEKLTFVRSGATPCKARAAAYVALEQTLVKDHHPKDGWRLVAQIDVSHLVVV